MEENEFLNRVYWMRGGALSLGSRFFRELPLSFLCIGWEGGLSQSWQHSKQRQNFKHQNTLKTTASKHVKAVIYYFSSLVISCRMAWLDFRFVQNWSRNTIFQGERILEICFDQLNEFSIFLKTNGTFLIIFQHSRKLIKPFYRKLLEE